MAAADPALPAEPVAAVEPSPAESAPGQPVPGQPDAFAAVRQALAPETIAAAHPFAASSNVAPGPGDLSAELMAAEEVTPAQVTAEEVTAVLTAVLDRLGAAHHRPFSRS